MAKSRKAEDVDFAADVREMYLDPCNCLDLYQSISIISHLPDFMASYMIASPIAVFSK